ncbi:hypothetical protein M9H77_25716 [Catharanthus roseus]|uniref:Uncharacterized protein n=1 Tax=Catharanthus roseus TaxID=4058 RepID=A0ACC0A7P0_CATRO|nr:hypothetical protein M9H77_25716 [Catharanthus roseus]
MDFDLENPLTTTEGCQNCCSFEALFANESDHMPSNSLFLSSNSHEELRISLRRQVFSLISQAHYCYNVDPFVTYLAVNYVDRFITKTKNLKQNRWIVEIFAISSLSLAAKMMNTDISDSLSNLQRNEGCFFEFQSIHRMEALILTTLSWRMRSITPFSFFNFFISMFEIKDSSLIQALKLRASHIIFNSHHEMKLLEHKPSVIAASALLCATHELIPAEFSSFEAGIISCQYVNNEGLLKCLSVMRDMEEGCGALLSSSTLTPWSVLDQHYEASEEGDSVKRRRLNDFCSDGMYQFSQIQHC